MYVYMGLPANTTSHLCGRDNDVEGGTCVWRANIVPHPGPRDRTMKLGCASTAKPSGGLIANHGIEAMRTWGTPAADMQDIRRHGPNAVGADAGIQIVDPSAVRPHEPTFGPLPFWRTRSRAAWVESNLAPGRRFAGEWLADPSSVGRSIRSRSSMRSTVTSAAGFAATTAGSCANLPWRGNTVVT